MPNAAASSDHPLNPPHSRYPLAIGGIGAALIVTAATWACVALAPDRAWHARISDCAILAAGVAVCLIYAVGVTKGAGTSHPYPRWSHVSFAVGIGTILLALASPLAELARSLFLLQQMEDGLLAIVSPIIIALAAPLPVLIGGLRGLVGSTVIARSDDDKQRRFDFPDETVLATVLFIVISVVWLYPPFQNSAVNSPSIQGVLDASMLVAGLLFWSRIFDFRPLKAGEGYGTRLMMLWIASLAHIGIGAYLTMKSEILYPAYNASERLFGIAALTDETVGGFIFWVPSAFLCLAAAIMVIHLWGKYEEQVWAEYSTWSPSNSAILAFPTTGAELIARARPKNRSMAMVVVAFAVAVFGLTIFSGVLNHLNTSRADIHARRSFTSRDP